MIAFFPEERRRNQMAKELKELNLIDNFLFAILMSDEEAGPLLGKLILQTVFQREFPDLTVRSEYQILPVSEMYRGVRLDAYIEEKHAEIVPNEGEIFDLEPDNKISEKGYLPKRSRYYHSKIDGKLLRSGKRFRDLKNVYVIFILSFDPFGKDRMVYTVKNRCLEEPEMDYEDGATTLFFIQKGRRESSRKH